MGNWSHVRCLRRRDKWRSSQSCCDFGELRFPEIPLEEICAVYACTDIRGVYGCRSDLCELCGCDRCVRGGWGEDCYGGNFYCRDLLYLSCGTFEYNGTVLQLVPSRVL